jgi:hypothetical protein
MKFQSILALAPAIIASVSAAPTERATGPDPSKVTFDAIIYAGSGCPAGSVANIANDDRTLLTTVFDSFIASVGPGVAVTENRKNCQMTLNIHYPGGFQFSIFEADYRGYAQLDANVAGLQKSTYYFSGSTSQATLQTPFKGPENGQDYTITNKLEDSSLVWSPCGEEGLLNINAQVQVNTQPGASSTAAGQLTVDSVDTKVTQIYSVQWRPCTK